MSVMIMPVEALGLETLQLEDKLLTEASGAAIDAIVCHLIGREEPNNVSTIFFIVFYLMTHTCTNTWNTAPLINIYIFFINVVHVGREWSFI